MSAEEELKNLLRTGAPLLQGKVEPRLFRLGKRRLWGDLIAAFQYLDRAYGKDGDKNFSKVYCNKTRGNEFKPKS